MPRLWHPIPCITLTSIDFQTFLHSDLKRILCGVKEGARDSGVKRCGSSSSWPMLYLDVLDFPEFRGSPLQATVKVRKDTVTEVQGQIQELIYLMTAAGEALLH